MDVLVTAPISHEVTWRTDALQAVKLDPAVLEAYISVNSDGRQSPTDPVRADLDQSPVLVPVSFEFDSQNTKKNQEAEKHIEVPEESSFSAKSSKFEDMLKMHKAALLSLSPMQFSLLLQYAEILRAQRLYNQKQLECVFCKNNGEPASWYSLHVLKDRRGRVRCPVLRGYRCRACGATGDSAHTIKYCPLTDRDIWSC